MKAAIKIYLDLASLTVNETRPICHRMPLHSGVHDRLCTMAVAGLCQQEVGVQQAHLQKFEILIF